MDETDRLIDEALDGLPLAPTPPGFTRRVMAEVWQPVVKVPFRLELLDFLLPAFFALLGALGFAVLLLGLVSVDPLVWKEARLLWQVLALRVESLPPAWLLSVGWALAAAACAVLSLPAAAAGLLWGLRGKYRVG